MKSEDYLRGYIAALRWVKSWYVISYDQVRTLDKKINEIKKKFNGCKDICGDS